MLAYLIHTCVSRHISSVAVYSHALQSNVPETLSLDADPCTLWAIWSEEFGRQNRRLSGIPIALKVVQYTRLHVQYISSCIEWISETNENRSGSGCAVRCSALNLFRCCRWIRWHDCSFGPATSTMARWHARSSNSCSRPQTSRHSARARGPSLGEQQPVAHLFSTEQYLYCTSVLRNCALTYLTRLSSHLLFRLRALAYTTVRDILYNMLLQAIGVRMSRPKLFHSAPTDPSTFRMRYW